MRKTYQSNDKNYKHRDCVYCEKSGNKASDCKAVSDTEEFSLTLSKIFVLFVPELSIEPLSKSSCVKCKGKCHFSIYGTTTVKVLL